MHRRLGALLPLALAAALTAGLATPAAAAPAFPDRIDLPPGWMPEGISAGRGTTVFVGSLATGAVLAIDVRTGAMDTLVEPGDPPAVGTEYDARSNRLWVAGGPSGEVRVYDATTGEPLAAYDFGAPSTFLNDLVVTRDAVYVTDSGNEWLNVIPLGTAGSLPDQDDTFRLPLGGDFELVPGFNANGIVAARGWLILVQSATGLLFRVDPATGDATAIDVRDANGDPFLVTNGDGLELRGSTLYVVRNFSNLVSVLRLGGGLASAEVVGTLGPDGLAIPATAAFAAGSLWAANARFDIVGDASTPYWITRLAANP